jgi:hypothetical protein
VIYWHRGRNEAPSDLSISAWRGYLLTHGQGNTIESLSAGQSTDTRRQIIADALERLYERIGNAIPRIVPAALKECGLEATAKQGDSVALLLWLQIANIADCELKARGLPGVLEGDESGEVDYPNEILKLCNKIIK